jgi:putative membrane protein
MAENASENLNQDPRVYLAAERTFLAWIRTSLALMAFGFVIARFGLFLREIEATHAGPGAVPSALSLPTGIAFVVIGVLMNILASVQHVRYIRQLNSGKKMVGRPSRLAITLAIVLSAAGIGMAIYLGATNSHSPGTQKTQNGENK